MNELKKETEIDNSELEELISHEITPEMEREVFKLIKEARLFMPVDFGSDAFENIENAKPGDEIEGPQGFSIQFLTDNNGNRAVPLFTSEEKMQEAGARTSVMVMYVSDLADMLKQTDKYQIIAINPFTEYPLNIPMPAFLAQFESRLNQLLDNGDLDELKEELLNSIMITGCVEADDGTNFVLIWDDENKPHLPLFTDIDEFKKIFDDYKEDVFPQSYYFTDLIKVAKRDLVINPASQSRVLDLEMFKD